MPVDLFLSVVEAALRGAPVLVSGLILARLLRVRSGAAGHAVLFGALAVQALLLVVPESVPPIRVTTPVGWEAGGVVHALRSEPAVLSPAHDASRAPRGGAVVGGAPVPDGPPADAGGRFLLLLAAVWSALSLLALVGFGRAVVGRRAWRRRARRATPLESREVVCGADEVGIRRRIEVLVSKGETVPATWGTLRPVLLLPEGFFGWPDGRRRAVILHELAHIRRCDALTRGLARALRTILWFDPLVWWAQRELFAACETACDDAVLAAGIRPSRYVGDLVAVALPGIREVAGSVPILRRGELERRSRAILDPRRTPAAAGVAPSAVATLVSLLVALPLAALTTVAPFPMPGADLCPYTDGRHLDVVRRTPDGGMVWLVEWEGDDCAIAVRVAGAVTFEPDLSTVRTVGPGSRLTIEATLPGGERHFEAAGGTDGERVTWRVEGRPRPFDDDARTWLRDVLHELDRHTAFAVDARLPALLAAGGADQVITLAGSFPPGHGAGVYLERLVRTRALSAEQLERLLGAAADRVTTDAAMASLLQALRDRYDAPTLTAAGYGRAAGTLQARAAREGAVRP